mgnify:CR=1 FL=1
MSSLRFTSILLGTVLMCLGSLNAATEETVRPSMQVDGAGFFKDRILKQQLKTIFNDPKEFFGPSDIEDAALILISAMQSDGFLEAQVIGTFNNPDGKTTTISWDKDLDVFLPEETQATDIEFQVSPGPRFYYYSLENEDNAVVDNETIESFFFSEPYFFESDQSKIFTPAQFTSGTQNLSAHLKILGYQDAHVHAEILELNEETGAASVKIAIDEGPLFKLTAIEVVNPLPDVFNSDLSSYLEDPYNVFIRQDIIRDIRNAFYESGYASANFEHTITSIPASAELVEVGLKIVIDPGSQQHIESISFQGAETVSRSLLTKQLTFTEGDLLNPRELDKSRLQISRLGLFQKVDYQLEEVSADRKSLSFQLRDRSAWELDALLGWGSYENFRLGLFAEKLNNLGRGHRLQFKTIVSSKSLLGESRYIINDFLDTEFPFSTKLFYLEREELSFDREEYGVTFGTSKYIEALDIRMDAVYNFESLDSKINERGAVEDSANNVRSGSIEVRFGRDKRDNPLNPQSGYRIFADTEWGAKALGGQIDYQAGEVGFSYHDEIKRGLIWHGALSHAVVGSINESQSQIPNNKLLFPGGENSVRGYQRGGAAPFDIAGDYVGAQSYALLNLELEQRLTDTMSIVAFYDAIGITADINQYPFDEYLSSIGLGIRFRTFMGPIRLEYGHNLDRRELDPSGTFHLTIGYPF